MRARGADFSSYQDGAHVQSAIQHGLGFALVKVSQSDDYTSPQARFQIGRLEASGTLVGLYHFLSHDVDGARQFDFFEAHMPMLNSGCVVACDQESDRGVLVPDAIARAFIKRGRQRGFKVGRYGDARVMGRRLGEDWRWFARWAGTPPAGAWDVWQFAKGEHGDPDWNVFKGDQAHLKAWWVANGRRDRPATPRWWLHDELEKVAIGPYRLPQLGPRLVAYVARHGRSSRFELVRK